VRAVLYKFIFLWRSKWLESDPESAWVADPFKSVEAQTWILTSGAGAFFGQGELKIAKCVHCAAPTNVQ